MWLKIGLKYENLIGFKKRKIPLRVGSGTAGLVVFGFESFSSWPGFAFGKFCCGLFSWVMSLS